MKKIQLNFHKSYSSCAHTDWSVLSSLANRYIILRQSRAAPVKRTIKYSDRCTTRCRYSYSVARYRGFFLQRTQTVI